MMKKLRFHISSRFMQLILVIFTIVLSVSIIVLFFTMKSHLLDDNKAQTIETVSRIVKQRNFLLTNIVESSFSQAETVASFCMFDNVLTIEEARKIASESAYGEAPSFIIFDKDGYILSSDEKDTYIGNTSYFARVMNGEKVITNPMDAIPNFSRSSSPNSSVADTSHYNEPSIATIVPIYAADGRIVGGVSCVYSTFMLENLLNDETIIDLGDTLLLDENHKVIIGMQYFNTKEDFFVKSAEKIKDFDQSLQQDIIADLTVGKGGFVDFDSNGSTMLMVYESNTLSDWTVITILSEVDLNEYTEAVSQNFLTILATSVGIIVFLYIIIATLYFLVIRYLNQKRATLELEKKELSRISMQDSMTKLQNKSSAANEIIGILNRSNENCKHAVFFIDIDNFKKINDSYGHDVGDQAILKLCESMQQNFRSTDIIARFGGDEFLVFVQNYANDQVLLLLAERLLKLIDVHNMESVCKFSISVGISMFPEHAHTYDELIACADKALYQSKKGGKHQFTIYQPETQL